MIDKFQSANETDEAGNPAGGVVVGIGLDIVWQDGPLGRGADRQEPNGAFVETVIAAVEQRVQFYQNSKFACDENAQAITALQAALYWLNQRTVSREARAVEGTHTA